VESGQRFREHGESLSFRRKLLLISALTVFFSVTTVAWLVSLATRRAFEQANEERTTALIAQFRREFSRRGDEVLKKVEAAAASEVAIRIALGLGRGEPDYAAYLNDAKLLADSQQLDFLEFVDSHGTIISSAQAPAKFGYKESSSNFGQASKNSAYLKQEPLPDGAVLGIFATRSAKASETPLYVIGGRRLDQSFLGSLELPVGMRAFLYQEFGVGISAGNTIDASGAFQDAAKLAPLITAVKEQGGEPTQVVHWSGDPADDETIHALPLKGEDGSLLGVLLVGNSQRSYLALKRRIGSAALLVGGLGITIAILLSSWAAARVTRPVAELAGAAREVAAGNWNAHVDVDSTDEFGELADAFNRMTRELSQQRERLVQTERVAAWRELARRLAHELKNPLFPLQLTVENLLRAREKSSELFEEIFRESTATLLAEIGNLKTIIGRFSEFSKMPQPKFQRVDVNDVVRNVARLFQAHFEAPGRPRIACETRLDDQLSPIAADPDLLHRAISNLVLNAMDAMPEGGTLTLRTSHGDDRVHIDVSDTGTGLKPEECDRLFTPYYTSKQHGTGLGLAIVQSIISDHDGRISVESSPGHGTTFKIELLRNTELLQNEDQLNGAGRTASADQST